MRKDESAKLTPRGWPRNPAPSKVEDIYVKRPRTHARILSAARLPFYLLQQAKERAGRYRCPSDDHHIQVVRLPPGTHGPGDVTV